MKEYTILVEEILSREVTVFADSFDEAVQQVEQDYKASEIVLDAADLTCQDIRPPRAIDRFPELERVLIKLWGADYESESLEAIAYIINTLADNECVKWVGENFEETDLDGNKIYLEDVLTEEAYEWFESVENRLAIIRDLLR